MRPACSSLFLVVLVFVSFAVVPCVEDDASTPREEVEQVAIGFGPSFEHSTEAVTSDPSFDDPNPRKKCLVAALAFFMITEWLLIGSRCGTSLILSRGTKCVCSDVRIWLSRVFSGRIGVFIS